MTNRTQPNQTQYSQGTRTTPNVPSVTQRNEPQHTQARPPVVPSPYPPQAQQPHNAPPDYAPRPATARPAQPPRQPARPKAATARKSDRRPLLILGSFGVIGVLLALVVFGALLLIAVLPQRIRSNVTINGIDVGGERVEDIPALLARGLPAQNIILTDGARQFTIPASELGVSIDIDATVAEAEAAPMNASITADYTVDLAAAQSGLIARTDEINIDAVPGRDGRAMDIPAMLERLLVDLDGEIADGVFELDMIVVEAPEETSVNYSGATTTHIVEAGQELALIARQYGVSTQDIVALNNIANADLIYPGQELTIPAAGEYTPANVPPAPTSSGRSIVVSTGDQRIYAYEDGQMVRSHLVSTGTSRTPTVLGDYRIYVKHVQTNMRGDDYFLPDVPYTMYFYQGYGIHGTYWHNSFGRPMSHGCVNLPVDEAEWFFNFASVGTVVRVV